MLKVFVASENPVKVNAVKDALANRYKESLVKGIAVASDIAAQPMSDQETYQGAFNRIKNLKKFVLSPEGKKELAIKVEDQLLFVAAEGGVYYPEFLGQKNELWSTVWIAVSDREDRVFFASGARFPLPAQISTGILEGKELADVLGKMMSDPDLRQKQGAIGVITENFVDRTSEYASIAKLAIGLWHGRKTQQKFS